MLDTPTYLLPEREEEKTRRRRLSRSVVVKTHTEREVGGRIYVHTAQRYIHTVQYNSSWWNWGKYRSLLML